MFLNIKLYYLHLQINLILIEIKLNIIILYKTKKNNLKYTLIYYK